MTDYSNKTVCVLDMGLFVEWAILLAREFKTVYYYMPWESSFPKSNPLLVGVGLPGVRRIKEFWSILDEIDLFVCPEFYFGTLQVYLEQIGKRVWGSRIAEQLELDRVGSKEFCKELGIPIGPYQAIKGLDALREYLREHDDQYVKVSLTRGDMESFYSKNYSLIEPRLDELEHNLGAKKKIMQFIVEQAITPAVETGYDGYTVDGSFPKGAMFGIEIKDKGYIITATEYDKLPNAVVSVNDKLGKAFSNAHYRGFWSTEVRVTPDGVGYSIDPCTRAGSPPSEIYMNLVTNWPDILWEGAGGVLVEPEFSASWGAELLLISEWADKNWQAIEFPSELRDQVKLRNACIIEGRYYVVPQWVGCPEIGAVVGIGDTRDEAVAAVRKAAEQVEGHYVSVCSECLDEAAAEFDKLSDLN
jgi:hypothetical protein